MLHIGYLTIANSQNIKKKWFRKFPFLSCRERKTASAGCATAPLPPPPPTHPSKHPNGVKNTQRIETCFIVNGQNIKKNSKNVHFSAVEGGKLLKQFVRTSGATELPTNSNISGFRGSMAPPTRI